MQKLRTREERVLHLRFGRGSRPISPQQAAVMLGISPPGEQRIERHALRRLRLGASLLVCGWDEV